MFSFTCLYIFSSISLSLYILFKSVISILPFNKLASMFSCNSLVFIFCFLYYPYSVPHTSFVFSKIFIMYSFIFWFGISLKYFSISSCVKINLNFFHFYNFLFFPYLEYSFHLFFCFF